MSHNPWNAGLKKILRSYQNSLGMRVLIDRQYLGWKKKDNESLIRVYIIYEIKGEFTTRLQPARGTVLCI